MILYHWSPTDYIEESDWSGTIYHYDNGHTHVVTEEYFNKITNRFPNTNDGILFRDNILKKIKDKQQHLGYYSTGTIIHNTGSNYKVTVPPGVKIMSTPINSGGAIVAAQASSGGYGNGWGLPWGDSGWGDYDPSTVEKKPEEPKCECGQSITLGKEDDPARHSRWCPVYKEV